jgi:hypothetical protein
MCGCGCNTCETKSTALVLNESKAPKTILSEGLKHHIDNNKPLTEHLYRAGSNAYFNLMAEARSLYSRGILEFTHEDDLGLLTETDLGHFGMYEGKQVPLDFPMELNEGYDAYDEIAQLEFEMDYDQLGPNEQEWVRDEYDNQPSGRYLNEDDQLDILNRILDTLKAQQKGDENRENDLEDLDVSIDQLTGVISGKDPAAVQFDQSLFGRFASTNRKEKKKLKEAITNIIDEKKKAKKKDNRPIGKPMRSSSGGKAYKVYVRDPKTKKIKTVRFGSGGLRAKINDSKARKAFAARHKCSQKKDRTKASYWSCRLPRYAKLLGLKSSFSGFW